MIDGMDDTLVLRGLKVEVEPDITKDVVENRFFSAFSSLDRSNFDFIGVFMQSSLN